MATTKYVPGRWCSAFFCLSSSFISVVNGASISLAADGRGSLPISNSAAAVLYLSGLKVNQPRTHTVPRRHSRTMASQILVHDFRCLIFKGDFVAVVTLVTQSGALLLEPHVSLTPSNTGERCPRLTLHWGLASSHLNRNESHSAEASAEEMWKRRTSLCGSAVC